MNLETEPFTTSKKIKPLAELKEFGGSMRVVLTNGCFDILHRGHVEYLEEAASLGDILIVAVNSDSSVRQLKGPTRPINSEADRARVIAGLAAVDHVVIFQDVDVINLLHWIQPDVWAKGGDYTLETLNPGEVAMAKDVGAEIKLIPLVNGYSTTKTVKAMKTKPRGR